MSGNEHIGKTVVRTILVYVCLKCQNNHKEGCFTNILIGPILLLKIYYILTMIFVY